MRFNHLQPLMLSVLAAIATSAPVFAATVVDAVKSRIAEFRELGAVNKNVTDELKSSTPQPMILQISARQIVGLSRDQYEWFPRGTGPESGVKTRAKPEIWTNAVAFKKAQDMFAIQAIAFQKATTTGNADQMRAASRSMGDACSGCHRQFRDD